jgi:hypothetical protein
MAVGSDPMVRAGRLPVKILAGRCADRTVTSGHGSAFPSLEVFEEQVGIPIDP